MLLYFLEGITAIGRQHVEGVGLSHAFPLEVEVAARQANNGPYGVNGVVVSPTSERCGYFADDQEWREISPANGKRRFCGWWKDAQPLPTTLARKTLLDGTEIELADGNKWQVPRAYQVDEAGPVPVLPASIKRLPTGTWTRGEVLPRYRRLWEITEHIFTRYTTGEMGEVTVSLAFDQLCEVLGANYRIGPDEVGALGLFETSGATYRAVVEALIDWDGWKRLQKKTDQDT